MKYHTRGGASSGCSDDTGIAEGAHTPQFPAIEFKIESLTLCQVNYTRKVQAKETRTLFGVLQVFS